MIVIVVGAAIGPFFLPSPTEIGSSILSGPSLAHPFGTDELGRDLLSRVVNGARLSLGIAMVVVGLSTLFAVGVAAFSALGGKFADEIMMRLTDAFFAFPYLILAMLIEALMGPGATATVVALLIVWWPSTARLLRGRLLELREETFVKAATASGGRRTYVFRRHLAGHLLGILFVKTTSDLGEVMLLAAGLSFIGLGVQPPTADWGSMLAQARLYTEQAWWYALFPGLALTISVVAFSLLGDGLNEVLENRRGGR